MLDLSSVRDSRSVNGRFNQPEKVAERLNERQLRRVIERLRAGSHKEKELALELLAERSSWERNSRRAYLSAMKQLVRKEFPGTPLGARASAVVFQKNPRVAERLALELTLDDLSDAELRRVARFFSSFEPGTKAFLKLIEIQAKGGSAGKAARRHIELKAGMSRARVAELSRKWRRSRSAADLLERFHRHLARLPKGTKRRTLLSLLGRPNEKKEAVWRYVPDSATALHISLDEAGLLDMRLHS